MVLTEGSYTLYVPREAAFHKQQQQQQGPYIKYGVFSVGGRNWEIHVYLDGAGTLSLRLCLLSATTTEVPHTEIWTTPDRADKEIGYTVHKPNAPKEIYSVTVPPSSSDKNTTSIFIKVVLKVSAADTHWNSNSVYISFGDTPGDSGKTPGQGQWSTDGANFFDGSSADPPGQWNTASNLDTTTPPSAWDSKADISNF